MTGLAGFLVITVVGLSVLVALIGTVALLVAATRLRGERQ